MTDEKPQRAQPLSCDDHLLTPIEAARWLGVTVGTLNVWRSTRRYRLPYVKVGKAVRYRVSALREFATSREVTA